MAFIEIFWATYALFNLLIAHLRASLPGLIYSVRPGWRARQDECLRHDGRRVAPPACAVGRCPGSIGLVLQSQTRSEAVKSPVRQVTIMLEHRDGLNARRHRR